MGDLDTSLIKEFSIRPAFYNKTSPHFKDKAYVENAWLDIAHKLGYNVTMLKDRMYQLRNRYNLEKRKVENMRLDGQKNPKSSWALFNNLKFLDGHIRPRKSYKSMMKRESFTSNNNHNNSRNSRNQATTDNEDDYPSQPMIEIKFERDDNNVSGGDVSSYQNGYETEDDTGNNTEDNFLNPANFLDDTESENDPNVDGLQQSSANNTNNSKSNTSGLTLRNINTLKRTLEVEDSDNTSGQQQQQPETKQPRLHQTSDKFHAFGTFIASSLQDLPESKALEIIEKFTNEIVRALIQK